MSTHFPQASMGFRPTQRELETGTFEKTNSKHLGSGPEQQKNGSLGGGGVLHPGSALSQNRFPRPSWPGYAFILKCTRFALAAASTLHLIGNRSNPLIVKMNEPSEEFHKAAHPWLDLHKRFKVL